MGTERKMVDSGVEWLGKIPNSWEIARNKDILKLTKTQVKNGGSAHDLLSLGKKGIVFRDKNSSHGKFPANFDTYQLVNPGDFVFCLFDVAETPRTIGRAKIPGMVTGAYDVFSPTPEADPAFLEYFYTGMDDRKAYSPLYSGMRNTISKGVFGGAAICLPPLPEQQAIATFLDHHVGLIDRERDLIAHKIGLLKDKRKALIFECVTGKRTIVEAQHLAGVDDWSDIVGSGPLVAVPTPGKDDPFVKGGRLVDSGVDWIGEVPEGWGISKMKQVAETNPRVPLPLQGEVSFIPMEKLLFGEHLLDEKKKLPEAGSYTKFADGDILVAKVTPCFENGKIAIAKNLVNGVGLGSSEITPIRPLGIYDKYLMYVMSAPQFIEAGCATMNGTAGLQRVSTSFWKQVEIPLPPLPEQQLIATFLDDQVGLIDREIDLLDTKSSLLADKRKALIFEAVTGKIDCTQP